MVLPSVAPWLQKSMMFLLIEQNEAVLNHIVNRFDIMGILGNGADFTILEQASVQDCDIFIALTEYDGSEHDCSRSSQKNGS